MFSLREGRGGASASAPPNTGPLHDVSLTQLLSPQLLEKVLIKAGQNLHGPENVLCQSVDPSINIDLKMSA
jgi:hypothetical protein